MGFLPLRPTSELSLKLNAGECPGSEGQTEALPYFLSMDGKIERKQVFTHVTKFVLESNENAHEYAVSSKCNI